MPADPSPAASAARPCNPRPSAWTGPPARAVAARPRQCRPRRSPRGAPLAGPAQSSESVHPSTPPSRGFQRWRRRLSETPRRCSSAPIGGPPGLPGPPSTGGRPDQRRCPVPGPAHCVVPWLAGRRRPPPFSCRRRLGSAPSCRRCAEDGAADSVRAGPAARLPPGGPRAAAFPPRPGLCWARR